MAFVTTITQNTTFINRKSTLLSSTIVVGTNITTGETSAAEINRKLMNQFNFSGKMIALGTGSLAVLLIVGSYIYAVYVSGDQSDPTSYVSVLRFCHNTGDLWTDLIFTFILYSQSSLFDGLFEHLWMFSAFFLFVPYILSCGVCIYFTIKWSKQNYDNPMRLHKYLKNYKVYIYGWTITSGFYSAIDLSRSKLFYFEFFIFH